MYKPFGISITGTPYTVLLFLGKSKNTVIGSIRWPSVSLSKPLTEPQARKYMDAMQRCVNKAKNEGCKVTQAHGNSGPQIKFDEDDPELIFRRVLLLSDDTLFGRVERKRLLFGLGFTKPVIFIDGALRDLNSTVQAIRTLGQLIEDAEAWK